MGKGCIVFLMGLLMFCSISFIILGGVVIVIDPTLMGKIGGVVFIFMGIILLYASIGMLKSGLKIEELLEEEE